MPAFKMKVKYKQWCFQYPISGDYAGGMTKHYKKKNIYLKMIIIVQMFSAVRVIVPLSS